MEAGELIWEGSQFIENGLGVTGGEEEGKFIVFELDSGSYEFEVRTTARLSPGG